ncbi:ParB family protein [Klebsiella quasipneumoniae]|uniref:ParB family protein n=1 Tax=Klebsiella quasipneumoniae subsp. quasipneumoniae TaxID=1667327 RepID=A0AAW8XTM0_9ENTR|nr:ParB family protein [Klebsiella quasipneumoniae]MBM5553039.1 chromosome partitioning protein ParB [Klebsiella quasipneumoniae]MBM5559103.1 chromosome partitioning protein ParB [Klebsiella quasipneumoniae]MCJ4451476.1 ParB family protein [Klebsiella quasipneumoniae]MDV0842930.1 ParB family protein [Klebsiella quasipneumoniae subsp. quasipneumoniae]MDZ0790400.1 ParB family protein [Klebsiella quasipneumoniae]
MSRNRTNVGASMLQPGRRASGSVESTPVVEMPMVLTIEQLAPNPDNPRTSRNPRYDEIKASIKARGLDTVPKVTRDPDGDPNKYIFSDGGNTRYQILTELWQETGEERFFRIHVLVKPWPGRLQCVIGHLAENEVRGDLSFIEKALGIHKARIIYEEQLDKPVSMRELSKLLTEQGLPIDASSISRMESTLTHLYPWIPDLLESGLGRHQITSLLAIRQDAEKVWDQFCLLSERNDKCFTDVFGECCRKFNSPELWSPEMFRDEFIGDLLLALPHPELNYDRWMMELDPSERNRRYHFGEPEEATRPQAAVPPLSTDSIQETSPGLDFVPPAASSELSPATPAVPQQDADSRVSPEDNKEAPLSFLRTEVQPDMYGGSPVISGDDMGPGLSSDHDETDSDEKLISMLVPGLEDEGEALHPACHIAGDAIWSVPAYQDDIEHLQNMAFIMAWELGEKLGCEDEILPDRVSSLSPGYCAAGDNCSAPAAFLLSLAGCCPAQCPATGMDVVLIGGSAQQDVPVLDDENAIKLLRLMRVMRRLRELQRGVTVVEEEHDE